jgi:hypothetical protein
MSNRYSKEQRWRIWEVPDYVFAIQRELDTKRWDKANMLMDELINKWFKGLKDGQKTTH